MPVPARNTLAVVGAGPVGLEAAAAALERGFDVHVFERGEVGAHPIAWGHVRLFTTWEANVGPASARLLARHGWTAPPADERPTGAELAERVLAPLAATPELKGRVHEHAQVVAIGRRGTPRGERAGDPARAARPFRLLVREHGGRESVLQAFAVLDASGTYAAPAWAGSGGIPARGELYLAPQMSYHCDDVRGLRRARHAGKRTLVIGGGATACTTVLELAQLAAEEPGTTITWVTRGTGPFAGEVADDPLAPRARLFAAAHALRAGGDPALTWVGGAEVEGFEYNSATHKYRVALEVADQPRLEEADQVIVNAGYRPDLAFCRELEVREAGDSLECAEPGFEIVGAKSCGRAGGFRPEQGWAQVEATLESLAANLSEAPAGA